MVVSVYIVFRLHLHCLMDVNVVVCRQRSARSITFIWVCPKCEDWVVNELAQMEEQMGSQNLVDIHLHLTRWCLLSFDVLFG